MFTNFRKKNFKWSIILFRWHFGWIKHFQQPFSMEKKSCNVARSIFQLIHDIKCEPTNWFQIIIYRLSSLNVSSKSRKSVQIKQPIFQKMGNFVFQSQNCFCPSWKLEIRFQTRYYCSEIVLKISRHYVQWLGKCKQMGYSSNRESQ